MAQVSKSALRAAALAAAVAGLAATPARAQQADPLQPAREAAWAGRTDDALRLVDAHLAQRPGDRAALLERATYLAWRGDYAAAIETLDARAVDDEPARQLRARILAWDGRRDAAMALSAPAFAARPDDYDAAWTHALAARLGQRPEQALPALDTVEAHKPDSRDTLTLGKAVRLPLYSSLSLPLSRYSDSDDIEVRSAGLDADLRLSDAWRLLAGAARRTHSAPAGGPFAPLSGGDRLDETRVHVGARYAPSPKTALEVTLGSSRLAGDAGFGDRAGIARAQLVHQASDALAYAVSATRDRVAASPRALSAGIASTGVGANLRWRPGMRDTLSAWAGLDDFNDGNTRRQLAVDWRRASVRSTRVNLDLGLQGDWLGHSRTPGNGYYSPQRYLRIAPTLTAYFKLGDEAGVSLSAAPGVQRDETFDDWKRATDVGLVLTVGILTRWQFVASAGYSERINEFGRYHGNNVAVTLRHRF